VTELFNTFKPPTLPECKDIGITLGIPEDKSEEFYHHFNAQGWLRANRLPVTDTYSQMFNWKKNQWKFDEKDKDKLFPIKGKLCKCGMPAVLEDDRGGYTSYKCKNCMPARVKENYR